MFFKKKHAFQGKLVNVMQRTLIPQEREYVDDPISMVPIFHEGYFVNEDDQFIYLADKHNKERVYVAVSKNDISNIELNTTPVQQTFYVANSDKYEN